jgi:hypothetical protein
MTTAATTDYDAALTAARRYCGWHVTPVIAGDVVTVDGPSGSTLRLPTLKILVLESVTEDGAELDLADLGFTERGVVFKNAAGRSTRWTRKLAGVTVKLTHGYLSAPDFDAVVNGLAERVAGSGGAVLSAVGPFQYATSGTSPFTPYEEMVLASYRVEPPS